MNKNLRKIIIRLIKHRYVRKGFSGYMAEYYSNLILTDFEESKVSLRRKIWCYKRGFLSQRLNHYNLTEENYNDYLSDYAYYRSHPINGSMRKLIDDKLTTKYVFAPFDEFLPEYYYMINNGEPKALHNIKNKHSDIMSVLNLLKEKKLLAFKKESAFGGDGFYKVEYDDGIKINNKSYKENEFLKFIKSLDGYLVMEYIIAHNDIRKYYSGAAGVLRVMVINEGEPYIANAYLRVGSKKSGSIDAYTGSISAVVDIKSGRYDDAWMHDGIDFISVDKHPDSQIMFEGIIPKWDFVKSKLIEMALYVPDLKYMGFDVCVTEDGFKIFEVNSHQGIELYQLSYPLLKNNPASGFFTKLNSGM